MTFRRQQVLAVIAGGMVGSLARAGVAELFRFDPAHPAWPWATFAVNLLGCLVVGVVVTRHDHYAARPHWRPLLGTGLAGGLTTFSTLQIEVYDMLAAGRSGLAAGYVAASVVFGLGAVALATQATHRLHRGARA